MNQPQSQSLVIGQLATGHELSIPCYRFSGRDSQAPSVYIQANVHGAEVQGNAVIYQLMERLAELTILGDICLVPLANPLAINQKSGEFTLGRFDPITGINWNREYANLTPAPDWLPAHLALDDQQLAAAFRQQMLASIEARLHQDYGLSTGKRQALLLQSMAHQADIVLDLHTGPKSAKHLYCPAYAASAACYFAIEHVLLMPNTFGGAMDEAVFYPWWQLRQQAAALGRTLDIGADAFTLELGSQERIDMADAKVDAEGILAYLSYRGVIANAIAPTPMVRHGCWLRDYRQYFAPQAGMVEYLAKPGDIIGAGEALVRLLQVDKFGSPAALTECLCPDDAIAILHFASASVYQGTELYKLMTHTFELTAARAADIQSKA
ncbi:succinylglutamate desuccinylase/aspartoacylase family protein [Shewanella sp. NIFS-20-20]|uniref:succinylglutamate desuccinylase/aspartoacylase family protein n=1 Tax=Shewanella sp. NIFS-20-20 TaxID=2853806 RepID=UPI001C4780F1|nr:succinylglutamate desuccinylase/aspartoacylase family protein [Shewanella sp. NIFS-20-20]MBV7314153.1 succinylglutamate desuccinylase/aspartoacylase family protein [Shewanella sp. NIFS-20-20]